MNKKMNLKIRLTEFRADLHWSKHELKNPPIDGPYWVILSGGKADFTTKWWDPVRYQEVVNKLDGKVAFVQIGNKPEGGGARHYHPALSNTVNLVGKTNLREAFCILLHARGIISPITCFMHVAAAIGKPAIVVAGGREHWTWEAYNKDTLIRNMAYAAGLCPNPPGTPENWNKWSPHTDKKFVDHVFVPHQYLHTVGQLKCCKDGGCWKVKVTEGRPEQNCSDVVTRPGHPALPRCLDMVTVDDVVNHVLEYEKAVDTGELAMPTIKDLIVNIDVEDKPTPVQEPSPVLQEADKPKTAAPNNSNGEMLHAEDLQFKHLTFPITVCGLTYGDHGDLAIRCLSSVYRFLDPNLFKLRYAMNEPSEKAKKQVVSFLEDKPNVERLYEANPQVYKYPMMRRMFHDEELPLSTDWVMWFDDDSHVTDKSWLTRLGVEVDAMFNKKDKKSLRGYRMFGKVYYFHIRGNQWDWIKNASWNKNRPHAKDNSKRPPMDKSDFCTGGFWLVHKDAIMDADWPDPRIKHRGGDIMMGVAMWQRGFGVHQCYKGVKISDAKQRGYNEAIIGVK